MFTKKLYQIFRLKIITTLTLFVSMAAFSSKETQKVLTPPEINNNQMTFIEKTGEMVITHILLQQSDTEFCVADVRGKKEFVPFFGQVAKKDFNSSMNMEKVSSCSFEEKAFLEASAQKSFLGHSETQVALVFVPPLIGLGKAMGVSALVGGGVGCGFGVFQADRDSLSIKEALEMLEIENVITSEEKNEFKETMSFFKGFEDLHFASFFDSSIVSSLAGSHSALFSSARSFLKSAKTLVSLFGGTISAGTGALGGFLGGTAGSLVCENGVHYLFEKGIIEDGSLNMNEAYDTFNEARDSIYDTLNKAYDTLKEHND